MPARRQPLGPETAAAVGGDLVPSPGSADQHRGAGGNTRRRRLKDAEDHVQGRFEIDGDGGCHWRRSARERHGDTALQVQCGHGERTADRLRFDRLQINRPRLPGLQRERIILRDHSPGMHPQAVDEPTAAQREDDRPARTCLRPRSSPSRSADSTARGRPAGRWNAWESSSAPPAPSRSRLATIRSWAGGPKR